jgi:hypothetical protein
MIAITIFMSLFLLAPSAHGTALLKQGIQGPCQRRAAAQGQEVAQSAGKFSRFAQEMRSNLTPIPARG